MMERPWPTEAIAFEESVSGALRDLGGTEFTRACEHDGTLRRARLEPVLRELGLLELDTYGGEVELAAAALGVRAAGGAICPWPLPAQLAAPLDARAEQGAVHLCDGTPKRVEHLDLTGRAVGLDIRTMETVELEPAGPRTPMPLDPWAVPCRASAERGAGVRADAAIVHVVLTAFYVSGALDHVTALTSRYADDRHQFGRRIASFGAIQVRLADLELARAGLGELAAYTLLRFMEGQATLADALALRLQMLTAAETALANAHQVLGAIGLCEEHDVAVVDRHLQPCLRRPTGRLATTALLAERIRHEGFDALFPVRAPASVAQDQPAAA
jgi:acyl-CoA dehydrogenase